ncbi:MAG: HEPN domain-containing protein [Elusimicrobiota bacterium]
MEIRKENKVANSNHYLNSAQVRLEESKTLLNTGLYGGSISRSYYAMLDAATAALLAKNIICQSHAGVIDKFSLYFIKPGIIDKKHIRLFKNIKKYREDADYKHKIISTKEVAEKSLSVAEEFVNLIKEFIPKLL